MPPEGPPQARLQVFKRDSKKGVNAVDQALGLTCGGAFRNIITGEHDQVGHLDFRSQRQRTQNDGGINRVSDGGSRVAVSERLSVRTVMVDRQGVSGGWRVTEARKDWRTAWQQSGGTTCTQERQF